MRTVAAFAAATALAAPATAGAAELRSLEPCYVSVSQEAREEVVLQGTGYGPNAVLTVSIDGEAVREVTANAEGAFGPYTVTAPLQPRGTRAFRVTVTQRDDPTVTAERTSLVTALRMRLRPATSPARRKVRWSGRGFTAGERVYAHYVLKGRHRETRLLGEVSGACGAFDLRARKFPFRPETGTWTVRVDNQRRYTRKPRGVFYGLRIDVFRAG